MKYFTKSFLYYQQGHKSLIVMHYKIVPFQARHNVPQNFLILYVSVIYSDPKICFKTKMNSLHHDHFITISHRINFSSKLVYTLALHINPALFNFDDHFWYFWVFHYVPIYLTRNSMGFYPGTQNFGSCGTFWSL